MVYKRGRREEILAFFKEYRTASHSLDEVCERLLGGGGGKSSVYRIVGSLADEGILRKLSDPKSRHCKYQYVGGDECSMHLHLKCLGCGKLIHLDHEKTVALEQSVLSLGDFVLDESAFLFGKCKSCAVTG